MAVTVYDRNGEAWIFDQGRKVDTDPDNPAPIWVLDSEGACIAGFNAQAWTHFKNPQTEAKIESIEKAFRDHLSKDATRERVNKAVVWHTPVPVGNGFLRCECGDSGFTITEFASHLSKAVVEAVARTP
ncbi:hypothetical protein SEA_WATERMELON_5 [Mycobacterium phage Watermelon]|nr:hypothetical protein SEA_WATERMELON_5 [Mycobacterium phage Watermelon]